MEIGPVARVSAVAEAPSPKPVDAIRTHLPPAAVVQPPRASDPTTGGDRQAQSPAVLETSVERHLTIDSQTRLVVSQVFDQHTGDLLSQVPDQALLRLKAYAREAVAAIDSKARWQRVT